MSYKNEGLEINKFFTQQNLGFRVRTGAITHRSIVYSLEKAIGTRESQLRTALKDLGSAIYNYRYLNGEVNPVTISMVSQPLSITVPLVHPKILDWGSRKVITDKWKCNLGLRYVGSSKVPVTLDLNSNSEFSILLAGSSGSGKSVLLDGMIMSAAESNDPEVLRMVFIDIGNKHFAPFQNLPHTIAYATELDHALMYLQHVDKQLIGPEDQYEYRTMIVLDEIQMLTRGANSQYNAEFKRLLKQIAGRGRAYGYNIIISTQKPMASIVPTEIRDNCAARIAGRCESTGQSKMVIGSDLASTLNNFGSFVYKEQIFDSYFIGRDTLRSEIDRLGELYQPIGWLGDLESLSEETTESKPDVDTDTLEAKVNRLRALVPTCYDMEREKWIHGTATNVYDTVFGEGKWHANTYYKTKLEDMLKIVLNEYKDEDLIWDISE